MYKSMTKKNLLQNTPCTTFEENYIKMVEQTISMIPKVSILKLFIQIQW